MDTAFRPQTCGDLQALSGGVQCDTAKHPNSGTGGCSQSVLRAPPPFRVSVRWQSGSVEGHSFSECRGPQSGRLTAPKRWNGGVPSPRARTEGALCTVPVVGRRVERHLDVIADVVGVPALPVRPDVLRRGVEFEELFVETLNVQLLELMEHQNTP